MTPTEHYFRSARWGFVAFLAAGALVGVIFLTRGPDGQFHLVGWAKGLADTGLAEGVAHFLIWAGAIAFMGGCAAAVAWAYCRSVPAECPRCGGAAYWQAEGSWSYRCTECGHLHDTGLGIGD